MIAKHVLDQCGRTCVLVSIMAPQKKWCKARPRTTELITMNGKEKTFHGLTDDTGRETTSLGHLFGHHNGIYSCPVLAYKRYALTSRCMRRMPPETVARRLLRPLMQLGRLLASMVKPGQATVPLVYASCMRNRSVQTSTSYYSTNHAEQRIAVIHDWTVGTSYVKRWFTSGQVA